MIAELDDSWAGLSRTVEVGDFEGYGRRYHPRGVLVSLSSGSSFPIARALEGWEQGFVDTDACMWYCRGAETDSSRSRTAVRWGRDREVNLPRDAYRAAGPRPAIRLMRLAECLPELLGCDAGLPQHTTEGANGEFVVKRYDAADGSVRCLFAQYDMAPPLAYLHEPNVLQSSYGLLAREPREPRHSRQHRRSSRMVVSRPRARTPPDTIPLPP